MGRDADQDSDRSPLLSGAALSDDDVRLLETVRGFERGTLDYLTGTARQVLTLATALLGGSVAFLDDDVINETWRRPTLAAFLVALVVATIGIAPLRHRQTGADNLSAARTWLRRATLWRAVMVYLAMGLLLLGFGFAVVGSTLHG